MKKNLFKSITIGLMTISPVLLMGATNLGEITADASGTPENPEADVKCAYISGYSEAVYNSKGAITEYLPHGTSWRLGKAISIQGKYYFEVGTDEYIDGADGGTDWYTPYSGTVRVMTSQPAPLYTKYGTKIMSRALASGTYWHTDRVINIGGTSYMRVATDEYVCVSDAAPV